MRKREKEQISITQWPNLLCLCAGSSLVLELCFNVLAPLRVAHLHGKLNYFT